MLEQQSDMSSEYQEVNYSCEAKPTYAEWLQQELDLQTDDFSHPSLLQCLEEMQKPKKKERKALIVKIDYSEQNRERLVVNLNLQKSPNAQKQNDDSSLLNTDQRLQDLLRNPDHTKLDIFCIKKAIQQN